MLNPTQLTPAQQAQPHKEIRKPFEFDFRSREVVDEPEWHVAVKTSEVEIRVNAQIPTQVLRDVTKAFAINPQIVWPEVLNGFAERVCHEDDLVRLRSLNLTHMEETQLLWACHDWLAGMGAKNG